MPVAIIRDIYLLDFHPNPPVNISSPPIFLASARFRVPPLYVPSPAQVIVAGCLVLFVAVNLDNLLRYHTSRSAKSAKPQIEKRIAVPLLLGGVGTIAFFLESFLYVLQGYSKDSISLFTSLGLDMMLTGLLEPVGLSIMTLGYAIFTLSVVARGRYATSWQMPEDHKLVDWGPYRYVRHPSYLGYFLMFFGFLLMWQNVLALIPLIGIPGYALITLREEQMLVAKFGDKYVQYQKHVGRFLPKMKISKSP
jgi:protein-S-isoprenylcysteine O-methyltransferase Ste14